MATQATIRGVPQAIELFHLSFLIVLPLRLEPVSYVLKGGANLRYFYGSPRFSEDIDFDVIKGTNVRLAAAIDKTVASPALRSILQTRGFQIAQITKPKQTSTTQRWKVVLTAPEDLRGQVVRTEIEFSRRGADDRHELSQVSPSIVAAFSLRPPTVIRYLPAAMLDLKVLALVGRSETQARDVFDLNWLFRLHPELTKNRPPRLKRVDLGKAVDRALELSAETYAAQVVPFLAPEVAELYSSRAAWTEMQEHVAEILLGWK